jgi:hypothetical protein
MGDGVRGRSVGCEGGEESAYGKDKKTRFITRGTGLGRATSILGRGWSVSHVRI